MARDDLHFRLRIPEELKARIETAADEARRSMTAEIVARLDESFLLPNPRASASTDERANELMRKYADALTGENEALKTSVAALEAILFQIAHALRKASDGEPSALNALVDGERERSLVTRIVSITPPSEDR